MKMEMRVSGWVRGHAIAARNVFAPSSLLAFVRWGGPGNTFGWLGSARPHGVLQVARSPRVRWWARRQADTRQTDRPAATAVAYTRYCP